MRATSRRLVKASIARSRRWLASRTPDVDEEVVLPGHVVDRDRLGQRQRVLAERLHLLARVAGEAHEDERLHRDAERARLDERAEAGEDALLAQPPHPLEAARRGEPDPGRELLVRQPSIVLQAARMAKSVRSRAGIRAISPKSIRLTESTPNRHHSRHEEAERRSPRGACPSTPSPSTPAARTSARSASTRRRSTSRPPTRPATSPTRPPRSTRWRKGGAPTGSFVYARFHNPTVARYETALAALEGAEASVAFASGMAALTAVLLAARESGKNHVVAVRPLYGGSDALLAGGLLGHEVTFTTPAGDRGRRCAPTPASSSSRPRATRRSTSWTSSRRCGTRAACPSSSTRPS